jgi:hypothetical protein
MKREETKELINNPRDSCRKEKEALLIDLRLEQHKRRNPHYAATVCVCENSLLFLIGSELLLQRGWKSTCRIFYVGFFYFCNKSIIERGSVWRTAARALCVVKRHNRRRLCGVRRSEYGIINLFIPECVCQRFDSLRLAPSAV